MAKSAETFSWTDPEIELPLEAVKVFASNCMFNGTDWESGKSKYEKIREILKTLWTFDNIKACSFCTLCFSI